MPYLFSVAQIGNLLYRRIAFCSTLASARALELSDPSSGGPAEGGRSADYQSAIQQITNLRYEAGMCAKHIRNAGLFSNVPSDHRNDST